MRLLCTDTGIVNPLMSLDMHMVCVYVPLPTLPPVIDNCYILQFSLLIYILNDPHMSEVLTATLSMLSIRNKFFLLLIIANIASIRACSI